MCHHHAILRHTVILSFVPIAYSTPQSHTRDHSIGLAHSHTPYDVRNYVKLPISILKSLDKMQIIAGKL